VVSCGALIFGASGGLAGAIAEEFLARGWTIDLVTREARRSAIDEHLLDCISAGRVGLYTVAEDYTEFVAQRRYQVYIFAQALFEPRLLIETAEGAVEREIKVGLMDPMVLTRSLLLGQEGASTERIDFAFIGSTSAYSGFKRTAVYCAVKHGLLGFIRAMNDEYSDSQTRFWLFSMGTMNTTMGAKLSEQDSTSFLQPREVAGRIVECLASPTNLFEPEVVLRRRNIRFKAC
jgi:NAD(P)-dependent dehydrogenase (short-subunit alcohol dehydrogenase family)